MKALFEKKKLLPVESVNAEMRTGEAYVRRCEEEYRARVAAAADRIEESGASIIMLAGPSASGKTTTSRKLALELRARGHSAPVVSLDNFFKNIADYPRTPDGAVDMEHLHALKVDRVNECLRELVETGRSEMPVFDFIKQRPAEETLTVEAGNGGYVIIEGIHALNPELSQSVSRDKVFGIYVGLRTEYERDGRRVLATRELRITRRLVRDYYFRGHSVRNTLELWNRLQEGEEIWIKPFKSAAEILLDTSFPYEPGLFAPVLQKLVADGEQGGEYRDTLLALHRDFGQFIPLDEALVPPDSMLREFIGGLELADGHKGS